MLKLKPTFLKENGHDKFVVLSIEEYAALREAIEDADDARILEEAIRRDDGVRIPFAEVRRQLAADRRAKAKKRRPAPANRQGPRAASGARKRSA
jgi:PHD/YefM family antitoxin component YafN of YafNO toxin-antitoxin module